MQQESSLNSLFRECQARGYKGNFSQFAGTYNRAKERIAARQAAGGTVVSGKKYANDEGGKPETKIMGLSPMALGITATTVGVLIILSIAYAVNRSRTYEAVA